MTRRERQRRRRRNRGSPLGRVLALGVVLVICVLVVGGLSIAGWVVKVAHSAPNLTSLRPHVPGAPSKVYAADGTLLGYITSPSLRMPVAGKEIPKRLRQATVAIEDRRFYQHGALDYQGIIRAAVKDALRGGNRGLQGASTLTMQLVDNTYLPNTYRDNHDLKYKIVQAKLAEQLESAHSKRWILNSYLNDVPYGTVGGQTAYGAKAAAELFFDKPVQKLDLDQAALLAGLPQAPSDYNPFLYPKVARRRRAQVLQAMVRAHHLTRRKAARAARKPLQLKHGTSLQLRRNPYVFDFIVQQLHHDLCPRTPAHCRPIQQGGLKIHSTIDLRKEAIAQQAIDDHASLLAGEGGPGVAGAVASVDAHTGHVLAIANSSTYDQTRFDYATQANRQTGSAFKVFALMTLIHDYHGNPASTYYTSKPLSAGWLPEAPAWSVHTDTNSYAGTISLTNATVISDNTVFAQLVADEGMDKFNAMAHAMGITSPLDNNPAEVLGGLTVGVTPLQMADAYATIANGGSHNPATIIGRVQFPDGSTRNFGAPHPTHVFPYDEAYEGTSVLKGVITSSSGTGTAANYGCPAAGKTGTAENLANAWFVGYTPRMSTAVWVGNPRGNVPMYNGFGGVLAAPIWHQYMQEASGSYCGDWSPPSTPFEGTAFFGPHAASGSSSTTPSSSATSYSPAPAPTPAPAPAPTTTSTAPASTNGGTGVSGGHASYNNHSLYAQPPQAPPPGTANITGGGGGGHTH